MTNSSNIRFARRLSLVRALAYLTQTAEIQRLLDVHALPEQIRAQEGPCEASAYAEYGYLSSAQKTERFGRDVLQVLRAKEFAAHFDPVTRRYTPHELIEKLTKLRQWADTHGIPYDFFAIEAARHLINGNQLSNPEVLPDTPELDDLMREDVLEYVLHRWSDPSDRLHHPFEPQRWDLRFRSKCRRREPQHRALYALIERRVRDAQALGRDEVRELRSALPTFMDEAEAIERFGRELVALALTSDDQNGH